jgi:hypothetical protein
VSASLQTLHNAAHLVMLSSLGLEVALRAGLPQSSGCYANILSSFRRASAQPATRELVEEDAMVFLAGMVATQNLHATRRATTHAIADMAEANSRLAIVESDAIVRRAWITYLRHRVRAILVSAAGERRVLAVAELLDRNGYHDAVRYLTSRPETDSRGEDPAAGPPAEAVPPAEANTLQDADEDDGRDEIRERPAGSFTPSPEPPKPTSPLIVDVMHLSLRAQNCLKKANILTVEQLERRTDRDLARLGNVGKKTREEIITAAADAGITIRRVL